MSQDAPLDERQIKAARMEAQGCVMREIAEAVGVDRRTLYRWRDIPAYPALVTALKDDAQRAARSTLQAGAHKAAARIRALVDSDDHRVALAAAQTLLDRTGHPKTERQEIKQTVSATVDMGATDVVSDLDSAMEGL